MSNFIRASNPIWVMVDLVGNILDDSYYMSTLFNVFPYLPQPIYRDNQAGTPWSDPIPFNANGTLPDNMYWDDNAVYRLEIRQQIGATPSQSDPLIYEINDFVAGDQIQPGEEAVEQQDNQISNPQFAFISFVSPLSITTAGTYDIAPGWQLVLTGGGPATATVTQHITAGDQNQPANPVPSYYIEINTSGWSTAKLQQTFNGTGAIWANEFVAMSILARSNDGIARSIALSYVDNLGNEVDIRTANLTPTVFTIIQGLVAVPTSTNSTDSDDAFVNMVITLPATGIVDISNVQVLGQTTSNITTPATSFPIEAEETLERQTDHLFHRYFDSIIMQPKDSILTGWNFGLNPWQFSNTTFGNVANNTYLADQTIVIQQNYVQNNVGNNISVNRGGFDTNLGWAAEAVTIHNQFGILQYIDPRSMGPYWQYKLSSLAKIIFSTSAGTNNLKVKMRLIYIAGLPSATSRTYPISSWVEGSDPVFAAGVTAISPLNDPTYTLTGTNELSFDQFQLPASSNANMTLGIFIYTISNMNVATDFIDFLDISLVPNDFAIASNPQTFDQVLRQCQYYYAKTFPQGTLPATAAGKNGTLAYEAILAGINTGSYLWRFPVVMRATPDTLTAYNPVSNNSNWYNNTSSADSGVSSFALQSDASVFIGNGQVAVTDTVGSAMLLNATADARLGL